MLKRSRLVRVDFLPTADVRLVAITTDRSEEVNQCCENTTPVVIVQPPLRRGTVKERDWGTRCDQ